MFKPNIRGVGRRNLRFELAGWRNPSDDSLIKHRYPWRRSWIELASADSSLTPVLARSGQVFLVQASKPNMASIAPAKTRSRPRKFLLFSAVSAIGFLAGVMFVPTASAKRTVVEKPLDLVAEKDCSKVFQNPEIEITKWLVGKNSDELLIEEVLREELGGIQLRRINASCGDQQEQIQITLTLKDKAWQLKKFTRLEN
jgi:hypothetical protein